MFSILFALLQRQMMKDVSSPSRITQLIHPSVFRVFVLLNSLSWFFFLLGVLLKVVVLSVLLVTVFVRMPPYSLLSSQCFVRMEVVFCHSLQCCNFSSCILKVAP